MKCGVFILQFLLREGGPCGPLVGLAATSGCHAAARRSTNVASAGRWSISWRVLELVEPVESHFLDKAVADHDQPRLVRRVRVEMLVNCEWRHVDEVTPCPFEFPRLIAPFPFECVNAVEFQVPMQVVARTLDRKQHLL